MSLKNSKDENQPPGPLCALEKAHFVQLCSYEFEYQYWIYRYTQIQKLYKY